MIELIRHTSETNTAWDACVRTARQAVFLFERGYMDYHADRFTDHSLLAYRHGLLIAVLPAHEREQAWISHGGLTFGGIVSGPQFRLADMIDLVGTLIDYARTHGFRQWIYKPVPPIYHTAPAQDDIYTLSLAGATLRSRALSLCIDLHSPFGAPSRRMGGVKTAQARGVTVAESTDLASFWAILTDRLRTAHGTDPVHSLDEMRLLHSRFPGQIRLYGAFQAERMIAGVLMYENARAARAQYIAADETGRSVSAVDLIMYDLLTRFYRGSRLQWVELGTSVRPENNTINAGLFAQKEKIGGRPLLVDTYVLDIAAADVQRLRMHLT
ncbi:MAG: GNAT family N-acetyltransferase [Anaerolinea sp.]|nr:GNAT family N-acetyltransferase [Anaerolinea sp.]